MFGRKPATRSVFAVLDATSGGDLFADNENMTAMTRDAIFATFSPDDRWLAVSRKGSVIRLFDLQNGRPLTELRGHKDEVQFLSFSGDAALLASASLDRTVRLWRLDGRGASGAGDGTGLNGARRLRRFVAVAPAAHGQW